MVEHLYPRIGQVVGPAPWIVHRKANAEVAHAGGPLDGDGFYDNTFPNGKWDVELLKGILAQSLSGREEGCVNINCTAA